MSNFVDVVGLVNSVLGFLAFAESNFPSGPIHTPSGTVQVAAGFATNSYINPNTYQTSAPQPFAANQDPDGNIFNVMAYDEKKDPITDETPKFSLQAGGTTDVTLSTAGGKDMSYIQIVGGDNGVCISWFTATWPDGSQYIFPGDWFYICKVKDLFGSPWNEWYYGNRQAGQFKPGTDAQSKRPWFPYCGWLDNDHTCGHRIGTIIVDVDYVQTVLNQNVEDTCLHHIWWGVDPAHFVNPSGVPGNGIISPGPIKNIPPGGPGTKSCTKKRAAEKKDIRLVRSDIWSHNATDLCMSDHSRGPDFVSLVEGMYCDMDTRKLTPLCHGSALRTASASMKTN
ncbi:hypothetical protein NA57DRAFT_52888 [Rhizodiscina lignyota]|uniref:Uncharacterized protein n=1 Tax=Rhizodiscina lignyota TaxID=1504668 RepID=A0A9P4IQ77_9PEZI|nr:hypothetical protein NA57DRAFT_52888 [Rhizodiscina lignyota]